MTPLFNLAQPYLLLCEYTYETSIYKVKECDRPFDNYLEGWVKQMKRQQVH